MKTKVYALPGLMNNEKLWSEVVPFLEDEIELIHIPIPLCNNFDEAIKQLDSYFNEEKINLLGFSLGAYLASYYTAKNPNRVSKLFLVGGTPSSLSSAEVKRRELTLKQMDNLSFNKLSTKKIKLLLEKKNQENDELINLIGDMFSSFTIDEYKLQLGSTFKRADIYNDLLALDIPINFLFSNKDRLLNHKSMEKIKPEHTNVILKALEGTSHMIPLEEPEVFASELKAWLKR